MRRWLLVLLCVGVSAWIVEASTPREAPPLTDTGLANFLDSLRSHHNVLERIDSDPNGSREGVPGYHVERTDTTPDQICIATGSGPLTTTEWECHSSGTGNPAGDDQDVQFNDGGVFGGTDDFIYDKTNVQVGIGTSITPGADLDLDPAAATSVTAEQISFRSQAQTLTLTSGTTLTNQRQNQFFGPTVNGVAGGATETVTSSATMYINGAPSGSNVTFTNGPWALWLEENTQSLEVLLQGDAGKTPVVGLYFDEDTSATGKLNGVIELTGEGNFFQIRSLNPNDNEGGVRILREGITGVTNDDASTLFVIGGPITLASGTTLTTHVPIIFNGPDITGISGGAAEVVTSAATVYISGGVGTLTDVTVTNDYALWIDEDIARFDGLVLVSKVTGDPCASGEPEGSIFYNDTSNYMCFCDGTNDVQMHDPTTACF